jgi:hypothetical protein
MIYTHVLNRGTGVLSPLHDALMLPAPSEPVRSNWPRSGVGVNELLGRRERADRNVLPVRISE